MTTWVQTASWLIPLVPELCGREPADLRFAWDGARVPLLASVSKLFLQGLHYFLIVGIHLLHFSC